MSLLNKNFLDRYQQNHSNASNRIGGPHLVFRKAGVGHRGGNKLSHLQPGDQASKELIPGLQPHVVGALVVVGGALHAARPHDDVLQPTLLQSLLRPPFLN